MPLGFHTHPDKKIDQQYRNTIESLIPFISTVRPVNNTNVLEVGCGEGGNLKAFAEIGCTCFGIDLSENKITTAREILREAIQQEKVQLVLEDIHQLSDEEKLRGKFDIILMKDVIEHVHEKSKLLTKLKEFLQPGGIIFLAFPPWYNPYGGHQQMSKSFMGKLPYFHLLPRYLSKKYLELSGESQPRIESFMEIIDTRLTISHFEKICRQARYEIIKRELYLINPIYKYKFGLKPLRQLTVVQNIPVFRDFVSTSVYYLIQPLEG